MKYLNVPNHDYSGTNLSDTGRSTENNKHQPDNVKRSKKPLTKPGALESAKPEKLNFFKTGETSEPNELELPDQHKRFHFKSFKEKIIKSKNQNTLNFNNLNILVEGNHSVYEPIVTSFKNFSQNTTAQNNSTKGLPDKVPTTALNQFKSPEKKSAMTEVRKTSDSMADLTFKKKYLRSRGMGRNMRPNSSVGLERQRLESPVLFYKSNNNPSMPIFKRDSLKQKKPVEMVPMEMLQNLKYEITSLTCRANPS